MIDLDALATEAETALSAAQSLSELKSAQSKYLGKSGLISSQLRQIGQLPPEARKDFGQLVNAHVDRLDSLAGEIERRLELVALTAQFERERLDVTSPGRRSHIGQKHVLQQTIDRIIDFFTGLGFVYSESPDLELFKYNFDALNYPPDHPAMDDQDTFFIDDDHLMRTQTTALQGRIFENVKPPLRYFTVGRCYRNEAVDRTHGHTFMQVDAFMIDEGVSMAHLKGTLSAFARTVFGEDITTRFRPDFFPFVEPGVDFAISSKKFRDGAWLELGGAGLIHPNILEAYGIETPRYSGFAFGLGVERIPMLSYGIEDLRHFFENDHRFLAQFPG